MINFLKVLKILKKLRINSFKSIILILSLGFSALVMEIVGLSLLIPIADIILNKELTNNFFINLVNKFKINFFTDFDFNIIFVIILFVYIIKFFIVNLNNYVIFWETKRIRDKISKVAIETFLFDNYLNYLSETKAKFIKNISSDVAHFTNVYISNLFLILEVFLIILISIFLLSVNFIVTIIILIFFSVIMSLYFLYIRSYVHKVGFERSISEELIFNQLNMVFNFFREIKILNKEKTFSSYLNSEISNQTKKIHIFSFINSISRPLIELIFVILIFGALFLISNYYSIQKEKNILTYVTVLLASVIRIMPSINRIIHLVNSINFSVFSVDELNKIFLKKNKINTKFKLTRKLDFNESIKLKKIDFTYKNSRHKLLSNFNLNIKKNSCIVIYGESGIGKSTILNLIAGLILPDKGKILIDNQEINSENILAWQRNISVVSQNYFMFNDTIKNNIIGLSTKKFNNYLFRKAIEYSQLENTFSAKKINNYLVGENGSKLSGGQNQRISIARAIYSNRDIMLMDEPTSMLDLENKIKIVSTIKKLKKNKTIIIVSHDPDLIKIADQTIKINFNL